MTAMLRTGTVGVVGLGLIGGSVALDALDRRWPLLATAAGVPVVDVAAIARAADLVVVATPPAGVGAVLRLLDELADRPLLVTSVASVQGAHALGVDGMVFDHVEHLGGHPMTGTERSGFAAARRGMFDGSPWIVTASPHDSTGALRAVTDLALGLGATPVVVPPDEHDRTVALLSHLPHVLAYSLYGRLLATGDHGIELLAGGSFRDATRVAATRPSFWSEVLDRNRDAVAGLLGEVRDSLGRVEQLLRSGAEVPALEDWIRTGHREIGRPRPSVPVPTPLPPDDEPLGEQAFAELRRHTRAGLSIAGWHDDGAATWTPL